MKSSIKSYRGTRETGKMLRTVATATHRTGELAIATNKVVAKRMSLAAAAIVDPGRADHAEFGRILPEKTVAFSQAGMAWMSWSGKVAEQMSSFALAEMASASAAVTAMAACKTPGALIDAQSRFVTAWFGRAVAQSMNLGALAMRSQGAVIAPIHRVATANARRLGR
jgi:hypothetical protein